MPSPSESLKKEQAFNFREKNKHKQEFDPQDFGSDLQDSDTDLKYFSSLDSIPQKPLNTPLEKEKVVSAKKVTEDKNRETVELWQIGIEKAVSDKGGAPRGPPTKDEIKKILKHAEKHKIGLEQVIPTAPTQLFILRRNTWISMFSDALWRTNQKHSLTPLNNRIENEEIYYKMLDFGNFWEIRKNQAGDKVKLVPTESNSDKAMSDKAMSDKAKLSIKNNSQTTSALNDPLFYINKHRKINQPIKVGPASPSTGLSNLKNALLRRPHIKPPEEPSSKPELPQQSNDNPLSNTVQAAQRSGDRKKRKKKRIKKMDDFDKKDKELAKIGQKLQKNNSVRTAVCKQCDVLLEEKAQLEEEFENLVTMQIEMSEINRATRGGKKRKTKRKTKHKTKRKTKHKTKRKTKHKTKRKTKRKTKHKTQRKTKDKIKR